MKKRLLIPVIIALACFGCSKPRSGLDRFVGEFVAPAVAGSTAFTLERDGRAKFTTTWTEEGEDKPRTEVNEGTYRVLGDTAFIAVRWVEDGLDSLRVVLRGDTLVLVDDALGLTPTYVRR